MWFYIIISIVSGFTLVVSRIINARLAEKIGITEGTMFNYITGLMVSVLFLMIIREPIPTLQDYTAVPFWAYLGGLLGIITVALSSYITPKISAFYVTILIFIGQLFVGVIIDYFTQGIMSPGNIIGGILVLSGLTYNLLLDRQKQKS